MQWAWSESTENTPSVASRDPCSPRRASTIIIGLAEPACRRPASAPGTSARPASWRGSSPGLIPPTMCVGAPGEARKCAVCKNELFRSNYFHNEPGTVRRPQASSTWQRDKSPTKLSDVAISRTRPLPWPNEPRDDISECWGTQSTPCCVLLKYFCKHNFRTAESCASERFSCTPHISTSA